MQKIRPEGGIEPLCLSAPTGLKTTEDHLDISLGEFWDIYLTWKAGLAAGKYGDKTNLSLRCKNIRILNSLTVVDVVNIS